MVPRGRVRSPGRERGSRLEGAAAPGPVPAPAPPEASGGPLGTPRARPPGVRRGRARASTVPTDARGTGSPPTQRVWRAPGGRARRVREPPRSAPPTRRAAASPAARPRRSPTTTEADPGARARARGRARRRSCPRRHAHRRRGARRVQPQAAPRTPWRRRPPRRARTRPRRAGSCPRPSARRSRVTWCWTAFRGALGRSPPHSASTNVSVETTRPDRKARHATSACRLAPGTSTGSPATTTSNGPRSRTSSSSIRPAFRSREQSGTPGCAVRGRVTRRPSALAPLPAAPLWAAPLPARPGRPPRRPPAGRASPPAAAPPRASRDAPDAQ